MERSLPPGPVLRQAFRLWMQDERGYSPATRRSYAEKADQAERFMVATFGRRLIRCQPDHVRAYLATFPWAKTRNCHRTVLRSYFRFARERGYRATDPTADIRRLPEPRYLPRPLSLEHVKRLRKAASTLGLRHRVIVDLALFAGLRRSEIAGLRWADVDLSERRLRVFGKGRKEGVVPLHADLGVLLALWRLVEPSAEWVFPSPQGTAGRHLSGDSVWLAIRDAGARAGLTVVPHMLRHSFATRLLDLGSDLRHVQELLRHASIVSTQVYTKVAVGSLEPDIARLDFGE